MPKIIVLASGTRGDVQPAVALSSYLNTRGYGVTICGGLNIKDLADAYDCRFIPMGKALINASYRSSINKNRNKLGLEPIRNSWEHILGDKILLLCSRKMRPRAVVSENGRHCSPWR